MHNSFMFIWIGMYKTVERNKPTHKFHLSLGKKKSMTNVETKISAILPLAIFPKRFFSRKKHGIGIKQAINCGPLL